MPYLWYTGSPPSKTCPLCPVLTRPAEGAYKPDAEPEDSATCYQARSRPGSPENGLPVVSEVVERDLTLVVACTDRKGAASDCDRCPRRLTLPQGRSPQRGHRTRHVDETSQYRGADVSKGTPGEITSGMTVPGGKTLAYTRTGWAPLATGSVTKPGCAALVPASRRPGRRRGRRGRRWSCSGTRRRSNRRLGLRRD